MNAITRHWELVKDALADERASARGLVRAEEVSFLPAALEIIERPVSPTARITTWVLLIGLVLTILWLTFGKIDIVASAPGRLIPADNVKLVQPAQAGVVRAILVRDGQQVRKGQTLIELDPTVSTADATQARRALETAELDAARSRAVLSALDGHGLVLVPPPGTPPELLIIQRALARAQLDQTLATIAGHGADRDAASAARAESRVQAAKLDETLPLLDQQIEANETLLAKGFVSKLRVIEMRRQRLAAIKDRDIAIETARKAGAQMASAGSALGQSRAEARARVLTDLSTAEGEAKLRREELVKATQRSSLQRLVAPVDGTVAQLAVHTVGGVVEPTKPLMIVVPSGGALVAEVKVLNRDVGFVRPGQLVALKLEAFPFTRYGTVPGRIESLSPDAIEDEKLDLVYTARVSLARHTMKRGDAVVSLTPGMTAVADIRTGQRSIFSYLISPIDKSRLEAARER